MGVVVGAAASGTSAAPLEQTLPTTPAPSCCETAASRRVENPAFSWLADSPVVGWVFDTSPYPPRWYCGTWKPAIGWLHIASDTAIWLAYMAIPCVLFGFARRRQRLPFRPLLLLFSAFILCCGVTHLMEAVIFWWPAYGFAGVLKFITACVSVATAAALAPAIPKLLAMHTPDELELLVLERTEELEMARRHADLLVESSPAGIVLVDQQGNITRANAVMEQIFHYRREEMVGRPIGMLLPERFGERHKGLVAEYFKAPTPRRMGAGRDVYARRADGMEFPVEIGLNSITSASGPLVLAAIVDVSEQDRLRREVEENAARVTHANEALHRSNAELEQFAFVASHDLQEPLRKITAFCQLVKEGQGDRLDQTGREHLDIAINGAERLKALVRDLLAFSRITSRGKQLRPTDSAECLSHAVSDLGLEIADTGATVTQGAMPWVQAEPAQLRALFQNLIGNALKYHGDDSPMVHIEAEADGDYVRFTVSDNGMGIDPEHHEKVFPIFQRLHNRRDYSGTGIGLAQCKKIVERFRGSIRIESEVGEGSRFIFTLPQSEPAKERIDDQPAELV